MNTNKTKIHQSSNEVLKGHRENLYRIVGHKWTRYEKYKQSKLYKKKKLMS